MLDFYISWEGCLSGKTEKEEIKLALSPPPNGFFKFNVDVAARGKTGPTRIRGVLRNLAGISSLVFWESVGVSDSNEAEILGIRKSLSLWVNFGQEKLIIEGDLENAIKSARVCKSSPWKLVTIARQIRALCSKGRISSLGKGLLSANR